MPINKTTRHYKTTKTTAVGDGRNAIFREKEVMALKQSPFQRENIVPRSVVLDVLQRLNVL